MERNDVTAYEYMGLPNSATTPAEIRSDFLKCDVAC